MASLVQYFSETRQEMKRVSWPNRTQLWETTVVVIVTVAIITVCLFVVDWILNSAVNLII
ncbi:MAG TPA: preprotein translocase subunit SecE [Candidatus Krumholzibacteria bacterium]|nr:preprotein translocase subunit SecE [Candidatus Krumholzibacteria bacterium]HPD72040.1 preprotein translocase subunit SecE [Candidatus Krumholzibacteria bacterium]HRY41027.1 preprotein translocase subunit SecE [Candidatus Krumholzibacteria bacterium]